MNNLIKKKKGQALVVLLVFVTVMMTIASSAVVLIIVNSQSSGDFATSESALRVAEAGAENAIIRLIRNSSYTGETLSVGDGMANISVTGSASVTIISQGVVGGIVRKVQVLGSWSNNAFVINSWSEII